MDSIVRVSVTVTFLRMDRPPTDQPPALPAGYAIVRAANPSVAFYRYLYNTVGADYVWWLRRTMSDSELQELLGLREVSIHTLYVEGEPAGFFELDDRGSPDVNLSYFGLMPWAVGTGIGYRFLRAAIDTAWRHKGAHGMTVNTCTADHPRALPTYIRSGFRPIRQTRELWNVPTRLGLRIPPHVRA